jgi:hypothetical protein
MDPPHQLQQNDFPFHAIAADILAHYSGLPEVLFYYPSMNQNAMTKPQLINGNQE